MFDWRRIRDGDYYLLYSLDLSFVRMYDENDIEQKCLSEDGLLHECICIRRHAYRIMSKDRGKLGACLEIA